MTAEDKNTKQNADQPSKSKEQPSNQNDKVTKDDDNSIGYNGEKKTALDLEIEREVLEMMENEDPEPEKQKKGLKIAGILSAFVIAILAIIRFINRTI
ncbi:hypothetical protein [Staphylococcus haemolyticus]|uniref:hypothetical protein n=1 Tax=Staphylococcus haemolyticus TaxID=1283 RepID=UPI001F2833AA|nr:hypothetical protein [Staphylococcus haemolyticus]MCE4964259.1 hypothetical protein [Staphylococcus haemolyticus]